MTKYDKSNPSTIQSLFDSIAPRYDLGNAVLSGNLHRLWNRALVTQALQNNPKTILDLCCGTGEIAKRMMQKNKAAEYYLVDFSEEMLQIAKKRLACGNVNFLQANAEALAFENSSFDAATCAYGIRNIQNRAAAFSELYRVLKNNATLAIVELTRPQGRTFNMLHRMYLRTMVPLVGRFITSNEDAYKYLCASIETFVAPEQIVKELENAGFCQITVVPQTFGIATLFYAKKI